MPVYPFVGRGFPYQIDYRKKGALILTSLLEDLGGVGLELRSSEPWFEITFAGFHGHCLNVRMFVGARTGQRYVRNRKAHPGSS